MRGWGPGRVRDLPPKDPQSASGLRPHVSICHCVPKKDKPQNVSKVQWQCILLQIRNGQTIALLSGFGPPVFFKRCANERLSDVRIGIVASGERLEECGTSEPTIKKR